MNWLVEISMQICQIIGYLVFSGLVIYGIVRLANAGLRDEDVEE